MRCLLLALGLAASVSTATAASYVITAGSPNKVEFESKAPTETFTGKTDHAAGIVTLNPAALGDAIEVRVEVDMASLKTGSGMRDRHMREEHLHTDKFPQAVFTAASLTDLSAPELAAGQEVTAVAHGEMELHGVKKPLDAPVVLSMQDGALHVVAHFPITLADYAISRPQFLIMKLGETQKVTVDIVARVK